MPERDSRVVVREVRIPVGENTWLYGDLALPSGFEGLVLFAHGTGSGRHSARNRQVARHLQDAGIATLLLDLLTAQEEQEEVQTRHHRFNIPLLTRRMQDATLWVATQPELQHAAIGYFGASTGSAAALIAAARLGDRIAAVVSRGGRPDLAGPAALAAVRAPTLMIVGGADPQVIELNQAAYPYLQGQKNLVIVPGATHLFEEAGALEEVAKLATSWFSLHLGRAVAHGTADVRLPYRDRRHAGRVLAGKLAHYRGREGLVVVALPRGGVAVGYEVAHKLHAPLDILVVRKLGYPGQEEYAMGAIAGDGVQVLSSQPGMHVGPEAMTETIEREQAELARREQLYHQQQPALPLEGRTVIVVDDGLATGMSMQAAVQAVRQRHPLRVVVAVPVGARDTCAMLRRHADEVICPAQPEPFRAVGLHYEAFPQCTDEQVNLLLKVARREHPPGRPIVSPSSGH